jgi:hypothetical protein
VRYLVASGIATTIGGALALACAHHGLVGLVEDLSRAPPRDTLAVVRSPWHELVATAPEDCRVGIPCEITIAIAAAPGWHVNRDYPTVFRVGESEGVSLDEAEQTTSGASYNKRSGHVERRGDGRAVVRVVVTPVKADAHWVAGIAKFATCDDAWCRPEVVELRLVVRAAS